MAAETACMVLMLGILGKKSVEAFKIDSREYAKEIRVEAFEI